MNPILRRLLYLSLIFFVIFVVLQPYNRFCSYSGKCEGIYVSDLVWQREGNLQINIIMEAQNKRADIDFETIDPKLIYTVSGRKNIANYRITNTSNNTVIFRPKFYVEPQSLAQYLIRRECLCSQEYSVKKGQTLVVRSIFKIDPAIEKDLLFNKDQPIIRIGYIAD